jgi:hypothetical protein
MGKSLQRQECQTRFAHTVPGVQVLADLDFSWNSFSKISVR